MSNHHDGQVSVAAWNEAFVERFFKPENEGRQVFLFVTDELVDEVAGKFGASREDLVSAVAGPPGDSEDARLHRRQIATRAARLCAQGKWRDDRTAVYPPYLAHLSLFAWAAASDDADDGIDYAYYSKLALLLGLPADTNFLGFEKLADEVWPDLERWSVHDLSGDLGVFRKRVFGKQRHVGVPRSQTLLTENELDQLPAAFTGAGLDPASPPSDLALTDAVDPVIKAKTRRILRESSNDDLRRAVLDAIREELEGWDGTASNPDGTHNVGGHLYLCIEPNPGAATGKSYLRCSLSVTYPEDGLYLSGTPLADVRCSELAAPWSTRVAISESEPVDASRLDWAAPFQLTETGLGWHFRLPKSGIRLFEEGAGYGLQGWVETRRARSDRPMLVAYPPDLAPQIDAWAATCTGAARRLPLAGALPEGWLSVRVEQIESVLPLRKWSAVIDFARSPRIRLMGGLRPGRKARYFAYGPPHVVIDGVSGGERLEADDAVLQPDTDGIYELPAGHIREDTNVVLRLIRDGEELARRNVSFLPAAPWTDPEPAVVLDRAGQPANTGIGIVGAAVHDSLTGGIPPFQATPYIPFRTAALIGRSPGEVSEWPADGLPAWDPIWAIGHGRNRIPIAYCGDDPVSEAPFPAQLGADRRRVREWKRQIWVQRKKIDKPTRGPLVHLWQQYEEAAKTC